MSDHPWPVDPRQLPLHELRRDFERSLNDIDTRLTRIEQLLAPINERHPETQ